MFWRRKASREQTSGYVELLLRAADEQPDIEDDDLVGVLIQKGVDALTARRLVVFVPSAFGRLILHELGVRVDPTYEVLGPGGRIQKRRNLSDVAEFTGAFADAPKWRRDAPDGFRAVAFRSSEIKAVNELLLKGSKATDLALTPMLTSWDV